MTSGLEEKNRFDDGENENKREESENRHRGTLEKKDRIWRKMNRKTGSVLTEKFATLCTLPVSADSPSLTCSLYLITCLSSFSSNRFARMRGKVTVKKTRKGQVQKIVKEHYLRDDIHCGSSLCKKCKIPSDEMKLQESKQVLSVVFF
jgi:hypothetical protein